MARVLLDMRLRLDALPPRERETVERAVRALVRADAVEARQIMPLAERILAAWEENGLHAFIEEIADAGTLDNAQLAAIFIDADVVTALHAAELQRAKLRVLVELHRLIRQRAPEHALRDHIARHPWVLDPRWETFTRERLARNVVATAAEAAKLAGDAEWRQRVDSTFRSGTTLLVAEYMRPGLKLDWDHVLRFEHYVDEIQAQVDLNTALGLRTVQGILVADRIDGSVALHNRIQRLRTEDKLVITWRNLLAAAVERHRDVLDLLIGGDPRDPDVRAFAAEFVYGLASAGGYRYT